MRGTRVVAGLALAAASLAGCADTTPDPGGRAADRTRSPGTGGTTAEPTTGAGPAATAPATASTTTSATASPGATPSAEPVVVVLDPGHNGGNAAHPRVINRLVPAGGFRKPCNTTGTATGSGYAEHAFAWDVARRTARLLRREGITVVLTRPDDRGVGPCVDRRARIANQRKAALAVSIHADGAPPGVRGFHVAAPALSPDGRNRAVLAPSWRAARLLVEAFADATGAPRARYPGALVRPGLTRRDDLAGLNLARVPAVLIECANLRNGEDAANVRDPAWRQRAARGIARGVLTFVREQPDQGR